MQQQSGFVLITCRRIKKKYNYNDIIIIVRFFGNLKCFPDDNDLYLDWKTNKASKNREAYNTLEEYIETNHVLNHTEMLKLFQQITIHY